MEKIKTYTVNTIIGDTDNEDREFVRLSDHESHSEKQNDEIKELQAAMHVADVENEILKNRIHVLEKLLENSSKMVDIMQRNEQLKDCLLNGLSKPMKGVRDGE